MKRSLLLLIVMIFISTACAMAQHPPKEPTKEMMRELQEFKLKFLTKELDLTDNQRQRFVDTYSKMEEERRNVFCNARRLEMALRKNKNASESDYATASAAMTEAKAKDAEIEKKYDVIFSEFLSKKQIFKLKEAEEKFRHKMRELHSRKKKGKRPAKACVASPDQNLSLMETCS